MCFITEARSRAAIELFHTSCRLLGSFNLCTIESCQLVNHALHGTNSENPPQMSVLCSDGSLALSRQ